MRQAVLGGPDMTNIMSVIEKSRVKSDNLAPMTPFTVSLAMWPEPLLRTMYLVVIKRMMVKAMLSSELNMLLRVAMWKNTTHVYMTLSSNATVVNPHYQEGF